MHACTRAKLVLVGNATRPIDGPHALEVYSKTCLQERNRNVVERDGAQRKEQWMSRLLHAFSLGAPSLHPIKAWSGNFNADRPFVRPWIP